MITVFEKRQDANVIHMIVGDNTEMQLDMDGSILMDISGMISDCAPGNPILIKYNRCSDEDKLMAKLHMDKLRQQMIQQGMMPNPFAMMNQGNNDNNSQPNQIRGRCKRCGTLTNLPVVNGQVQPCKECQLIDAHIKRKPEPDKVTVDMTEEDKKFMENLLREEKKPIRKKRPVKKKEEESNESQDDVQ